MCYIYILYYFVIYKLYSHSNSYYQHQLKKKCLENSSWKYTNTQTKKIIIIRKMTKRNVRIQMPKRNVETEVLFQ